MFWVMWFVTASRITDPVADNASHSAISRPRGAGASATTADALASAPGCAFAAVHASAEHRTANPANIHDHPYTCWPLVRLGSTNSG